MDSSLSQLIRDVMISRELKDNSGYTHHTYYGPRQRLELRTSEYTKFWTTFCNIISSDDEKDKKFSLAEVPSVLSPILVNCVLRFQRNNESSSSPYGEDFILGIVFCYQKVINEILMVSQTQTELLCCVSESDFDYVDNNQTLIQFKLQFPYCRVDTNIQKRVIRPKVIEYFRELNLFSKLDMQPIDDWEVIIDPLTISEPWPLYRCTSNPLHSKLTLTHIYGVVLIEHIEKCESVEIELEKAFLPHLHGHIHQHLISVDMYENKDIEHWLPMFLSLNYWQGVVLPRHGLDFNTIKTILPNKIIKSSIDITSGGESIMDAADTLLSMLSKDRAQSEHYWLDIGKALWTCDQGNERGLQTWIRFTEISDNHDESDCQKLYLTFRQNNTFSLKTIAWYAKQDNIVEYLQWHKNWCIPALERATSITHDDIAEALYRVYWLEFACASSREKRWYQFKNHRWNLMDQTVDLNKRISGDFLHRFESFRTQLSVQIQESSDENFKKIKEIMIKQLTELIKKLKSITWKGMIMKAAIEKFHDSKFDDYADNNPNLMGLLNGVVEVCDKYAFVRDGKPEDYVTMCSGVFWKERNWKDPEVLEYLYWMRQCFPDPELDDFFQKLIASCLRSGNFNKKLPIMTGDGNNSKSMVKKSVESEFGPYSHTFPTSVFTQRQIRSSGPNPEIALSKRAKIAWFQEPEDDEDIKSSMIKMFTGMDSIFGRVCNKDGGNFEAVFKLFGMCNKIPTFFGADKATQNRVDIVPFNTIWVDPDDPKSAHIKIPEIEEERFKQGIFKMDANFSLKIPRMASAALWVHVQRYADYARDGLKTPNSVKVSTDKYWEDNDVYRLFTAEMIRPAIMRESITTEKPQGDRDPNSKLTLTDVYTEFKVWFRDAYPGIKVPERSTAKYQLEQRWGKLHGKPSAWHGIKFTQSVANV